MYEKSCRICLIVVGDVSIYEKRISIESNTIADILMEMTKISISFNDNLPSKVCENCATRVEFSYNLKLECESSDMKLRNALVNDESVNVEPQDLKSTMETSQIFNDDQNKESKIEMIEIEEGDFDEEPELESTIEYRIQEVSSETKEAELSPCEDEEDGGYWQPDETEPTEENVILKSDSFDCTFCDRKFFNKGALANHLRRHKPSPHRCPFCGKEFRLRQNLLNHQRTHTGEKPYQCDQCQKMFSTRSNLTNHRRTHSTDKPFVCHECGKQFPTISHLRSHSLSHVPISERKYSCEKCNKTFRDRKVYSRHLNLHNGIRNEMCEICGKKFCNKNDVTRHHKTVHLGIKKYVCSVCGKAFSNSSNLESHFRIHTGEKPFHCLYCDAKFNQSTPLVKHTKLHKERGDPIKMPVPVETKIEEPDDIKNPILLMEMYNK